MGMYCGKLAYQFFLIDFMHEQKIFFFNMFKKPKNLDWFCKVFNFFFLNQKQEKKLRGPKKFPDKTHSFRSYLSHNTGQSHRMANLEITAVK